MCTHTYNVMHYCVYIYIYIYIDIYIYIYIFPSTAARTPPAASISAGWAPDPK